MKQNPIASILQMFSVSYSSAHYAHSWTVTDLQIWLYVSVMVVVWGILESLYQMTGRWIENGKEGET